AAAGALPKGAQTVASDVLRTLGVNVPNPSDDAPNVVIPAAVDPSPPASPNVEFAEPANDNTNKVPPGLANGNVSNAGGNGNGNGKAHANQDKVPPGQANGTASNAGGNGNGNGNSAEVHGNSDNAGAGNDNGGGKKP